MKKMLMLASVASMIDQFNLPNIELLQEMGYEVHVACNFEKGSTCTEEKIKALKEKLKEKQVTYFQIDFNRNVLKLGDDFKAYQQVLRLCRKNRYEFLHCHSPIGGVVGRLVGHKTHTKVIYTAHGFHFYKGAPIQNWLIYYPIEKFLSRFTDVLITINKEDYELAEKKLHAKKVEYVPGVGVDISKFRLKSFDAENYRKILGINENDFAILSVGELNENKNHQIILKAISALNNPKIQYFIVGKGEKEKYLLNLATQLGIISQVHLLGFRSDIAELDNCVDVFILPSIREGLNVSLMEAVVSGTTCIASDIRGNNDILSKEHLFNPQSVEACKLKIQEVMNGTLINKVNAKKYGKDNINNKMKKIYLVI